MSIYRGNGGSGNADTDAVVNVVVSSAADAAASASSAAVSATNSALSATQSATSAASITGSVTAAASSASSAASSASAASTSATAAASSASSAATSASSASTSATSASTSASNAATSATNAAASAASAAAIVGSGTGVFTAPVFINSYLSLASPTTYTGTTYTVVDTDTWIIANVSASSVITLPAAASYPGRALTIKTIRNNKVDSASSNVAPIASATVGVAIVSANTGRFATLVSNGTSWITMAAN